MQHAEFPSTELAWASGYTAFLECPCESLAEAAERIGVDPDASPALWEAFRHGWCAAEVHVIPVTH